MSRRTEKSRADRPPSRSSAARSRTERLTGPVGLHPDAADETAAGRRFTGRSAVILAALVLVIAGLLTPIGTGLAQMQQIAALEEDIRATEGEVENLQAARDRLDDPEHLERLARERLNYVHEGEKAYIVVGGPEEDATHQTASAGSSRTERARPWYVELADSLRAVGFIYEENR